MFIALAVNVANVATRYLAGWSIYWADESMIFLIIASVCLGGIAIAYDNAHLGMDLLQSLLPKPLQTALNVFIAAVTVGIFIYLSWIGSSVVDILAASGQKSIALGIPMTLPHSALVAGFGLSAVAILARMLIDGRLPRHEAAEDVQDVLAEEAAK